MVRMRMAKMLPDAPTTCPETTKKASGATLSNRLNRGIVMMFKWGSCSDAGGQCRRCVCILKGQHRIRNSLQHLFGELGIDRQGQHFVRCPACFGAVAWLIAQVGEAILLMQRAGIVDFGTNPGGLEVSHELVAIFRANDVLVVNADAVGADPGCDAGRLDCAPLKGLVVVRGIAATRTSDHCSSVRKLNQQNCRLEGIEPEVAADKFMWKYLGLAPWLRMILQPFRQLVVAWSQPCRHRRQRPGFCWERS